MRVFIVLLCWQASALSLSSNEPLAQQALLFKEMARSAMSGHNFSKSEMEAIKEINNSIIAVTFPDIEAAHDADQGLLNEHGASADACTIEATTRSTSAEQAKESLQTLKSSSEALQSNLISSQSALSVAQSNMDNFIRTLTSPSCTLSSDLEETGSCLESNVQWYETHQAEYQLLSFALGNTTSDVDTKSRDADLTTQQLSDQECYMRPIAEDTSKYLQACLTIIENYNSSVTAALENQNNRKHDWFSAKQVLCFLKVLAGQGSTFEACMALNVEQLVGKARQGQGLNLSMPNFDASAASETQRLRTTQLSITNEASAISSGVHCPTDTTTNTSTVAENSQDTTTTTSTSTVADNSQDLVACSDGDVMLADVHGTMATSVQADVAYNPWVFHQGQWYPVCGHSFWNNDRGSDTACRMVGFTGGVLGDRGDTFSVNGMGVEGCSAGGESLFESCSVYDWPSNCLAGMGIGVQVKCSGAAPSVASSCSR